MVMMSAIVRPIRWRRLAAVAGVVFALLAAMLVGLPRDAAAADYTTNIAVYSSTGSGIQDARVLIWTSGSWNHLGYTDASGVLATTLPQSQYRLRITYNNGAVDTGTPVDVTAYSVNTASVTLLNTGQLAYQGWSLGYGTFTNPMELLPFTYNVMNNGSYPSKNFFDVTVGDEDMVAVGVRLLDSNGNGLAGGTLSYYIGGWYNAPGQTDANGNLVVQLPSNSPNLSMRMHYNGTSQQMNRAELNSTNFTFRTAAVNVKLIDADGNPLDTGSAEYYANGWRSVGATVSGTTTVEMLPGSYSFAMTYNGSRQQRDGVAIATPSTDVVFQTGRVTLHSSGPITWYQNGWRTFAKPTMEYLPGTTTFYFSTSSDCRIDVPIQSGDHLEKSVIIAKLRNSAGQPLAGGDASAYLSGWRQIGTTNSAGYTCAAFDGKLGNTAVAMVYNGTRQQVSQQHATVSIYTFTTSAVTVKLTDSAGNPIDTGDASYYASGWRTIGATSSGQASVQMLPGSYAFAMTYNGTRNQQNGVPITLPATTVTFSTVDVAVRLIDSNGDPLDTGSASYYANGWRTIGTTSGGAVHVQMLPGNYSFAMTYLGGRSQQNGVAVSGTTSDVTFQTGTVTSTSGAATSYYASGWKPFTNGMELLGGNYTFAFNDTTPNTLVTIVGGQANTIH